MGRSLKQKRLRRLKQKELKKIEDDESRKRWMERNMKGTPLGSNNEFKSN